MGIIIQINSRYNVSTQVVFGGWGVSVTIEGQRRMAAGEEATRQVKSDDPKTDERKPAV